MILVNCEYPELPCEDEERARRRSTISIIMFLTAFIPGAVNYLIQQQAVGHLFMAWAVFWMFIFIFYSTTHCSLRDDRQRRNIEALNEYKGEWKPSGDGTMSYIVDGQIQGLM